jgi:3-oxoacyl-(acyl-carrier-protein) synthase
MDSTSETQLSDPIALRGIGTIVVPPEASFSSSVDVLPWLKSRKMRKFMGKQDQLAVIAAGLAAREAGLSEDDLRSRTGIYLCVGYIPFERAEIEVIARNSTRNGQFSMELFSTKGFEEVNPLLTFRCLPNMPIFHVSLNLNVQGPYFITYPGAGQFYIALEQAILSLQSGEIEYALVGGVADQNNFLVQHHFERMGFGSEKFFDAAGFLCLKNEAGSSERKLLNWSIKYNESPAGGKPAPQPHGAATLPILLQQAKGKFSDHLKASDGIDAQSDWVL